MANAQEAKEMSKQNLDKVNVSKGFVEELIKASTEMDKYNKN